MDFTRWKDGKTDLSLHHQPQVRTKCARLHSQARRRPSVRPSVARGNAEDQVEILL
ncbi:hypothetical protein DPMN_132378 [Dreissena polymorpha]|uniref:Uncharacterized protein n=1 Tax=Dreissena polymorpha TaxID=45954 RepID=A0A9D4JDR6_DREPO|nr:hypothetical protein DPMN_132378 [Dreissena polymorpha]